MYHYAVVDSSAALDDKKNEADTLMFASDSSYTVNEWCTSWIKGIMLSIDT